MTVLIKFVKSVLDAVFCSSLLLTFENNDVFLVLLLTANKDNL